MVTVSVVMPAYNAAKYIAEAIDSLINQSFTDWELILVNDGSTDETLSIAESYSDPRIKITNQKNQGEAGARNTALNHIRGQFLAFLDADDVFFPYHLEKTVNYLKYNPGKGGVFTDGYFCDEHGNYLKPLSSKRRGPFEGRIFEEFVYSSDVLGPPTCVVVRSSIVKQYQLRFDPDIVIGPDWDFFTHFADKAQFGYLDQYTCLYRVHQTNITFQVGLEKRALELAKCRLKAIKLANFENCSLETQTAVFYDLLVNLLDKYPDRQTEITYWSEFKNLPTVHQGRLLRLMSSKAIIHGVDSKYITDWLTRSRKLSAKDRRVALLRLLYRISPYLCKLLLEIKTRHQEDPITVSPFIDLD